MSAPPAERARLGIPVAPAAAGLPRLLAGLRDDGTPVDLREHELRYGPLPSPAAHALIEEVERSGLRGRGGADFPTATKLRSVAARRRPSAVIVNASETEPASDKDGLLVAGLPHLVLDGAVLAARAVGAPEVIVRLSERTAQDGWPALEAALAERAAARAGGWDPVPVQVSIGPDRYVSGEESAIIGDLEDGVPLPRFTPPRPFERGYRKRPTLIQNAETLAHLALIGRFGARWFRTLGTQSDPGTLLVTLSGAVRTPGVFELELGAPLEDLLAAAGGAVEPLRALLVGGYFGTWISAADAAGLRFERSALRAAGLSLGAGVVVALGQSRSGLRDSARVLRYLADQSAGQCGPCVHGLDAIATSFTTLVDGSAHPRERQRLLHWASQVTGRGACAHPNGAVRLLLSALEVFGDELAAR